MLSLKLYNYLPLYAQLTDDRGVLQTMLELGIQLEIDRLYKAISDREITFDPYDSFGSEHLDWLGQLFGLTRGKRGSWVGIGMNPQWTREYKQDVILEISDYWRNKGSQAGISIAIALWLEWKLPDIKITSPLGNNWQDYNQSLAPQLDKGLLQRRRLGSGDYFPGVSHVPAWSYGEGKYAGIKHPYTSQSRLAEKNIWLELYPPTDKIWNNISSHLPRLLIESVAIDVIPTPVCWWKLATEVLINRMQVFTATGSYTIFPGSTINSKADGVMKTVAREFFFKPKEKGAIRQIRLYPDGGVAIDIEPTIPRLLSPDVYVGFLAPAVKADIYGARAVFVASDGTVVTAIADNNYFDDDLPGYGTRLGEIEEVVIQI